MADPGRAIPQSSDALFERAQRVIPGGVNSPVRAFRGVGGRPFFVARAEGCRVTDVDGRTYIDFLGSWGPLILGHAAPMLVEAVSEALARGTSYGAPTAAEVDMAELISRAVPSMEMTRLVSSGTEAAMSAIRLARGATGRDVIVKFEGCYHGHADSLLVKAGSGGATFGVPDSLGVPAALAALTVTVPFNDLAAVERLMAARGREVAAIIVEPVAGNMGVVPPARGFLQGLRAQCDRHGALLIFDEVITGFRVAYGGAQALYGVRPDLTCLGKIIGGGLPVGAYGGARAIMERVAPLGGVYAVSLAMALAAGLLWCILSGEARRGAAGALLLLLACGYVLRATEWTTPTGEPLRVALVQGNARDRLRLREGLGHGALRPLLPRDARRWRLPRRVAVRGGLRVAGPRRLGPRRGLRGGPPGIRGGRLSRSHGHRY